MVLADSHRITRVPSYSGISHTTTHAFQLQDSHLLRLAIPDYSPTRTSRHHSMLRAEKPTPQHHACNTSTLTHTRFRLIHVRSPLLAESLLFSLPMGTEMFHFPTFPPTTYTFNGRSPHITCSGVTPFGHPRITVRSPTPRGLSQVTTSFIGS